jgi:hypothetical protein
MENRIARDHIARDHIARDHIARDHIARDHIDGRISRLEILPDLCPLNYPLAGEELVILHSCNRATFWPLIRFEAWR